MSLRLRHLHLRVQTRAGLYGARLQFGDGLVILRAENSMGKSTCVQAIIYALGLERMLGPSADVPLPHVMTRYVEDGVHELSVLESEVILEVANGRGESMTIQREVVGGRDRRLISTWDGAKLTNPNGSFAQRDYYVRDPGAATHEAGFHSRMAQFLGWELPTVSRFNGTECPLYLEGIFPLFFVEQKHGWAGIQANLPTFLGIREIAKRALEFVLNLDAAKLAEERQKLDQEEAQSRNQWKNLIALLVTSLRFVNGRVAGLTEQPTAQWPPAILPQLEVFRGEAWVGVKIAQESDREELALLTAQPIPTVGQAADGLTEQLETTRKSLGDYELFAAELLDQIETEEIQLQSVKTRLSALYDDLQRNQDAAKLKSFGSVAGWSVSEHSCPTCHQALSDVLLAQGTVANTMSVEENITFIKNQIKTFERLQENSAQLIARKESELAAIRNKIDSLRAQIRALKQSLMSADATPSIEAVRQQLEIEGRLRVYARSLEEFDSHMDTFGEIAAKWKRLQEARRTLPADGLSEGDKTKLARFEQLVREQLRDFGFSSITPNSITISVDNYRPVREGFNLGFDLSASDNIRTIWAYLEGLLELASIFDLRHPGLLILDEPRQQETAELSFERLLRRASDAKRRGQQVLFVTSEPLVSLNRMTDGLNPEIIAFDGRVITKMQ